MKRLAYAQLDRLSRDTGQPQERDPETDIVYLTVGRVRYYATLPRVAESPAPSEACS